jgi:hypothetical protein
MTNEQFDELFETHDDMYEKYMEFIMENCQGDRIICNGDMLIEAAESFYLFEEFRDHWIVANAK